MVALRNILEEIVFRMIEELEENRNGQLTSAQKTEMAAYVLNRMKPLYTTSGRGFVYVLQKYEHDPQFQADIWVLLSQALKIVHKSSEKSNEVVQVLELGKYYYFFPRIYGRVLEASRMSFVEDGEVSLWMDGRLVSSYYLKWYNPYHIKPDEGGWYAFAPMPLLASTEEEREFVFEIEVNTAAKRHQHSFSLTIRSHLWQAGDEVFEESYEVSDMYI